MPMNRSPTPVHLMESAPSRPASTAPERLMEPPSSVMTPERAAARGLAKEGATLSGMMLHEDVPFVPQKPTLKTEDRDGETVTTVKLDVAYCDIINRNGRYYPRSCYEAANARAQPDLEDGGLYSLMDHPDYWEPVKGSLPNVVIKIEELGIDDRQVEWPIGSGNMQTLGVVWAKGIIVETAKGLDAKALLKSKVRVGVSTNGWASTQYVRAGNLDPNYYDPEELIPVTQDDFEYFSIDLVSDPSNLGGRARSEARKSPLFPTENSSEMPYKEGKMHELLLKLMEKYPGKTIEQIKAENAAEYLQTLEDIAQETADAPAAPAQAPVASVPASTAPAATVPAPAPAPVATTPLPPVDYNASTVTMEAYRALESRVVQLTSVNSQLVEQLRNQRRDTIALTALEAANLPRNGTFVEGGVTIDLDASFREDVISASRLAQTDEAAAEVVGRKIAERRAMSGGRQQENRRPGAFDYLSRDTNRGPSLGSQQRQSESAGEAYQPMVEAFSRIL